MINQEEVRREKAEEPERPPVTEEEELRDVEITFKEPEPELPFETRFFLVLVRFAASIVPVVFGTSLVIDKGLWSDIGGTIGLYVFTLGFPDWIASVLTAAIRILTLLFWLFFVFDIWRAIQIVGSWQRRNAFFLGWFVRCVKSGPKVRLPVVMTWGEPIDMRIRTAEWTSNLVLTKDGVLSNFNMTLDYSPDEDNPEKVETEVGNFDRFVLSKANAATRAVAGSYTIDSVQGSEVYKEFVKLCQERVGDRAKIHFMAVTDTAFSKETEEALGKRATQKAEAVGFLEARKIDAVTSAEFLKIAKAYVDKGLDLPEGQVAYALHQEYLKTKRATEAKGAFIFDGDVLSGLQRTDTNLLPMIRKIVEQVTGKEAGSGAPTE